MEVCDIVHEAVIKTTPKKKKCKKAIWLSEEDSQIAEERREAKHKREKERHGKQMGKQWLTLFFWAPKSLQMVTAAKKLKDACSFEEKL